MQGETRSTGFAVRLYGKLARLFPHRFRCAFEREMLETTEDAAVWIRRQNLSGLVLLFTDLAAQLAGRTCGNAYGIFAMRFGY